MQGTATGTIYDELGVKPVINARGHNTFLGGSSLSPRVQAAMEEANRYFVDMAELLERSGQIVADLLDAPAAYITPGAAAALALGTAACIAGDDGEKIDRLPDVTGLKHEIIIQRLHRYKYDRCPTIVGAKLREVGDSSATTIAQIEDALGQGTAAILFPAHLDGRSGSVSLDEVIAIGKRHGVPVVVDAAGQVYPLERMKGYTQRGADLVCFGAKYFGGPNSAGILCGRKDLAASASLQGFIGFETTGHRSFGRPMKLDRQEVVGVVVALRDWMAMDHENRLQGYEAKVKNLARGLAGVPGLTLAAEPAEGPATRLRIGINPTMGRTAADTAALLRAGSPSIWVNVDGDALIVSMPTVHDGDEEIIAERLTILLAK